jgi:hypothetical protein
MNLSVFVVFVVMKAKSIHNGLNPFMHKLIVCSHHIHFNQVNSMYHNLPVDKTRDGLIAPPELFVSFFVEMPSYVVKA